MSIPNLQIELGGFTDPFGTPLAGGYLLITLNHDENTSVPNQVASGLTIKVGLDNNGSIPVSPQTLIWSNDVLAPANSYYTVLGYKSDGTLSWGPQFWQLAASPNPLNVGTIVPVNPVGGFGGGGGGGGGGSSLTLQTNAVNNSNQALLNLSQGSGISLANVAGTTTITATAPTTLTLQTNSVSNSNQGLLNLAQGAGVSLSNVAGTTTLTAAGGGLPVAQLGDIARFNVNGDGVYDAVNYAQPFVGMYALNQTSNLVTAGVLGVGGAVVTGSQSTVNPTATAQSALLVSAPASASAITVIGTHFAENGSGSLLGMLSFYRWSFKASMGVTTNVRYWFGLGCVATIGAVGNNNIGISNPGTAAYATDSPNKTTIGFRYSAGVDTHWQAVTCVAGGAQTVVDTGVTPDTAIHLFEMTTNTAGTSIFFFIDGSLVATITTNLPSPAAAQNSWGDLFFTGDNKNTNNAIQLTFYSMQISLK